jgi:hypothetical protein
LSEGTSHPAVEQLQVKIKDIQGVLAAVPFRFYELCESYL